jgi:Ribbon-helix-helix protein, copG family
MPQKPRPHRVTVKFDAGEYAALEARAAELGVSRSAALRDALRDASAKGATSSAETPTRESTLKKLERAAQDGSVVAMATLARELRLGGPLEPAAPRGPVSIDELTEEELRLGLRAVR